MRALAQDLRQAFRSLRASPGFAAAAIVTLAVGVGANTALLSAARAVFREPLPYPRSDELVMLTMAFPGNPRGGDQFSPPNFEDYRRRSRLLRGLAAYNDWGPVAMTGQGEPAQVAASFVSADYFSTLGAVPEQGRLPSFEDHAQAAAVAVISDAFWRRQFGGDPLAVGMTARFNGVPVEIIGVASAALRDISETWRPGTDVWMPLSSSETILAQPGSLQNRNNGVLWGFGRLAPGATLAAATAEAKALSAALAEEHPVQNRGYEFRVEPMRDYLIGDLYRPVRMLWIGAGLVLAIGVANVAALLLVRSAARRRELAVRAALGAGRARLACLPLAESLLLACAGAAAGILVATWMLRALEALRRPGLSSFTAAELDSGSLIAAVAIALVTGLAAGLPPALEAGRTDLRAALTGSAGDGRAGAGRRRALVLAEVALATALLVAAALSFRSLRALTSTDMGYETGRLLTLRMDLRSAKYADVAPRAQFGERLLESVRALPDVESALLWGPSMLGSGTWILYAVTEDGPQKPEDARMIARHSVNPGGLGDLGIRIVSGRDFTAKDIDGHPRAAILSQSAARMLWPGKDPVGRRFRPQSAAPEDPWITVVGVAADARHRSRFHARAGALAFEAPLDCYFAYSQAPVRSTVLAVRSKSPNPGALVGAVRQAVLALDSDLPLYDVQTLESRLAEEEGQPRRLAALLTAYALVAATLASIGLYGVLAFAVARRTREIGVRIALGATTGRVLSEIAGEGLRVAAAGILLGMLGGWGLGRLLASQLYAISPADPVALAAAGGLLFAAAALASIVPARRAARLEVTRALRTE